MRLSLFSAILAFTMGLIITQSAQAAPQILGLVATTAPLPFTCQNGKCSVEVSAVCLQEDRAAPKTGKVYHLTEGSKLTLSVTDGKGLVHRREIAHLAGLKTVRSFMSVAVSVPEEIIRELGGDIKTASLTVGPMSSAIPEAQPGDKRPITKAEIATVTGTFRALAEDIIRENTDDQLAAGILNQMINRLPNDHSKGAGHIPQLRREVAAPETGDKPETVRLIDHALDTCREWLRAKPNLHLRACLSDQHELLHAGTTDKIWRNLSRITPGS